MKQQLLPVKTPWQVSPSTPHLRLSAAEPDPDEPTRVWFAAHFALRSPEVAVAAGGDGGAYQLVRVTFESGLWVKVSPGFSDRAPIDRDAYDWGEVWGRAGEIIDTARWLREFKERWVVTGFCPDPRMYEVRNSDWLRETGAEAHGYNHYLILGHDAYIEVLGRTWRWESERTLEDW